MDIVLSGRGDFFQYTVRLAALFHDTGKLYTKQTGDDGVDHFWGHEKVSIKIARERLGTLGYEEQIIKIVLQLIAEHDTKINPDRDSILGRVLLLGREVFEMLISLQKADLLAHSEWYIKKKIPVLDQIEQIYHSDIIKRLQ